MKKINNAITYFICFILLTINCINCIESNSSIQTTLLIKELLNTTDVPIRAIIALDSSSSVNGNEATSAAKEIIESVATLNRSENEIGYVSWNHGSENYNILSKDYASLIENISDIKFGGNTCFEDGLNKSILLLGKSLSNKNRNMIIIISDGEENCNLTNIHGLTCNRAKQIIPANVEVRTIHIGDNKTKRNILSCLEKFIRINDVVEGISKEMSSNQKSNTFSIKAIGSITKYQEQRTKVNITKIVEQGASGGPRIKIRIQTPDGPNVKNSIVLALDSSGSMGKGGNPYYGEKLREAIGPAMEEIKKQLPDTNVSILSWDDDIDFKLNFKKIDLAIEEVKSKNIFVKESTRNGGFHVPYWLSSEPYPENYYKCLENESTDFTVGLQGAIDALNNKYDFSNNDENNTDLKSIVFVAARSEFIPFSRKPNLIEDARKDNYSIYTLGIGVINKSLMETELYDASRSTYGKYHYSTGSDKWSKNAIADEVSNIVAEIRDMTLLDNIKLVDTVYPYLDIVPNSIRATLTRGKEVKTLSINPNIIYNRDGTRTVELNITENLSRNTILEISMDTQLNLSMPVDVTNEKSSIYWNWSINQDTRPSTVTYKWHTGRWYRMQLPENRITLK